MQASTLIARLVLGSVILAGGTAFVPALAQTHLGTHHAGAAGTAPRLTLHEVQLKLEAMGYREVTKLSREGGRLRIQATDPQGRRVDMDIDSSTGDILDTEARRSRPDHIAAEQASWLTLHQVQVKLEAMGYRDIERIQRKRDRYQATATNARGQRVDLAVTPRSGDIVEGDLGRRASSAGGLGID